ncbi:MAG TPA: ATP-binding protein [Longimicrobiales bacterium]|nr:ATP-binding protein [Longimicrobiales bacterium]
MKDLPTLRRELITAFAVVFAGALIVGVTGVAILLPRIESPGQASIYIMVLLAADVAVFALFGRWFIRKRVLMPLDRMIEGVEAIAAGDYPRRLPPGETVEVARLAEAVNHMAGRLIKHQQELAANIESLQETNRLLTEARDELVRAEKLASVGRFGAGIAHEIGNPLGAIIGYLGVLSRSAGERERPLIEAAEAEARRIDRIVRGLLDYARPREFRVRPIDVNAVVERTLDLLSTQGRFANIRTEVDLMQDLPLVNADPYQLEQVLVNLLLNATDVLEGRDDGVIWVSTRQSVHVPRPRERARRKDDPPEVDYSHRRRFHRSATVPRPDPFPPGGQVVEIAVADNGPGIPPALVDQVFEPFVTTKEPGKGTGLGLAVSARLIDSMNGTMRADNRSEGGAVFTVILPVSSGSESADQAG